MKKSFKTKKIEPCTTVHFHKPVDDVTNQISLACPACGRQSLYLVKALSGPNAATTDNSSDAHSPEANGIVKECAPAETGISVVLNIKSAETITLRRQGDGQDGVMVPINSGPMQLNQMLDALFEPVEFGRMAGTITVPGQGEYPLATFFQNFDNVNDELIGGYHGFWGTLKSANKTGTSVYFNTGKKGSMSVVLDEKHEEQVIRRFGISNYANLVGARMLVFGELKKAASSEKIFVLISDPSRFTLRLAR